MFKANGQSQSRAQILKQGLIGIAVVLILAFVASLLGGGNEAPENKTTATSGQDQTANKNADNGSSENNETKPIDTKDLLGAEPDAPSEGEPQRIPASRKFDYNAGTDDNNNATPKSAVNAGPLTTNPEPAEQPVTPPAQNNVSVPASNDYEDAVPVQDAENASGDSSPNPHNAETSAVQTQQQNVIQDTGSDKAKDSGITSAKSDLKGQNEPVADTAASEKSSGSAVLYCGKYENSHAAEEQKALLAFQGQRSTVTKRQGQFTLKLGPYKSKAEARNEFSKLDGAGLVNECALEDN